LNALVTAGLSSQNQIALDSENNVYLVNGATVDEWNSATEQLTTLVSGLAGAVGVAVDTAGNVYIAEAYNNSIQEWSPVTKLLKTLVSTGLNSPEAVAVDLAGNVYIADYGNNAIKEWSVATGVVTALPFSGLTSPFTVAVDILGNVYTVDGETGTLEEWSPVSDTVTTIGAEYLRIAVDGQGNVYAPYYSDDFTSTLGLVRWSPATQQIETVYEGDVIYPGALAVDSSGNIYVTDQNTNDLCRLDFAWYSQAIVSEPVNGGSGSVTVAPPAVTTQAASTQPWLTITGTSGGVITFSVASNGTGAPRTGYILLPGYSPVVINQDTAPFVSLGAPATAAGPSPGASEVLVVSNTSWAAQSNTPWLEIAGSISGTGNGQVTFSYQANPSDSLRIGTLTIGGATFTVTQAGNGFLNDDAQVPLVITSNVYSELTLDPAGNAYFAASACTEYQCQDSVQQWNAFTGQVTTVIPSVSPSALATDSQGNLYLAGESLQEWNPATQELVTLIASGLNSPSAMTVDNEGNVYLAVGEFLNGTLEQWSPQTQQITLLAQLPGIGAIDEYSVYGLAVDAEGNVYIAARDVVEWSPATGQLTTLLSYSSGIEDATGVAVDGLGNIYIGDEIDDDYLGSVKVWNPATQQLMTLVPSNGSGYGLTFAYVATDNRGGVYFTGSDGLEKINLAWISESEVAVPSTAGSSSIQLAAAVSPALVSSDASWLTIGALENGTIAFSYSSNAATEQRSGHILIPGFPPVTVVQLSPPGSVSLDASSVTVGPSAGSASVTLTASAPWTATSNASWLHISSGSASGSGSSPIQFAYDANTNSSVQTGTLTIAGLTFTVIQTGSGFVSETQFQSILGGEQPYGVAVDGQGNVYAAYVGGTIVWNASTQQTSSIAAGGQGVAVDAQGNVYVADTAGNSIQEWVAATQQVITLISTGLNQPTGIAVDSQGNVYIADTGNNAIQEWNPASQQVTTLVGYGLLSPTGVAVDALGNLYIANNGTESLAVAKWSPATLQLTTPFSATLTPFGVAVDSQGNIYSAGVPQLYQQAELEEWVAATGSVIVPPYPFLVSPHGVAADNLGNLYIADTGGNAVYKLSTVWLSQSVFSESASAGSDSVSLLPGGQTSSATSSQSWLTITGTANGTISFAFTANMSGAPRTAYISINGLSPIPVTQTSAPFSTLAQSFALAPPGAGTASLILLTNQTWTAASNASWLHVSAGSTGGNGSSLVVYSFDANPANSIRVGTLTAGGATFTVTQAGSGFVLTDATELLTSTGTNPALDNQGDVYFLTSNGVQEWSASTQTVTTLFGSSGFSAAGLAVDGSGNVYFTTGNTVQEWNATTTQVTTIISGGLTSPQGLALDSLGNLYIADTGDEAVKEWIPSLNQLTTLFTAPVPGGLLAQAVAVDALGNVYASYTTNEDYAESSGLVVWSPQTGIVANPVSVTDSVGYAFYVALDGLGTVYYYLSGPELYPSTVNAEAAGAITVVGEPEYYGAGLAADTSGNLYAAVLSPEDYNPLPPAGIKRLTPAYVSTLGLTEPNTAGGDSLQIIPTGLALGATSNQSWLSITGTAGGIVTFTFTANSGNAARVTYISIPGLSLIPVTQNGAPSASLGENALVVPGIAGTETITLSSNGPWTAQSNVSWLHLSQSGSGGAVIAFTYDANPGTTSRVGTLTIAGLTCTVTQIGVATTQEDEVNALFTTTFESIYSIAVDAQGNIYLDASQTSLPGYQIYKWSRSSQALTTLVTGLEQAVFIAVDAQGNLYFPVGASVEEWNATTQQTSVVISSGLALPNAVAVDSSGNLYVTDPGDNAILEWNGSTHVLITLVTVVAPYGLAMDPAGDLYFMGVGGTSVEEWSPATQQITTLFTLYEDDNLAVDPLGNVYTLPRLPYLAYNNLIEWNAGTGQQTTLVTSGMQFGALATDSQGNVYMASGKTVYELTPSYEGPLSQVEPVSGGSGTVQVYPANAAIGATSDQTWLTITGISSGVISFTVAANTTGAPRTGYILIPGLPPAAIIQSGPPAATLGTLAVNAGAASGQGSVLLISNTTWTAQSNASWLHVATGNATGYGNFTIQFSYDANTGAGVRSGTLNIAGLTFTVSQAGSAMVSQYQLNTFPVQSGASGVAVDGHGNVFVSTESDIDQWNPATGLFTTLGSCLCGQIAVDNQDNAYFWTGSSGYSGSVTELNPFTQQMTELVNGIGESGVAVDSQGNVYIADTYNNAVLEWSPISRQVTPLVVSGLNEPTGVAVDAQGNIYIADQKDNAVKEWNAASGQVTTLVSSGISAPQWVTVDGQGNVFITGSGDSSDGLTFTTSVSEWSPATQAVTTIASQSSTNSGYPYLYAYTGIAADTVGNLYVTGGYDLDQFDQVFAGPMNLTETAAAGSDSVQFLPATLAASATSGQPWLTITGISNGTVGFAFTANTGMSQRTANIKVPGLTPITVTQSGSPIASVLAAYSTTVGSGSGLGSVFLISAGAWTAQSNASWLQLTSPTSGTGDTLIEFTYDANTSASSRTGTLTIAGLTFTVTQAGNVEVSDPQTTTLIPAALSGLNEPSGVAVDAQGNFYIADTLNNAIKEFSVVTGQVTTPVSAGLSGPLGVALDSQGNVYIADTGNNAIEEWNASTQQVTALVSVGLNAPAGVAVDSQGNVYIADTGNNSVKQWVAATQQVNLLVGAGLNSPSGVAVDSGGNVYIADTGNNAIEEWNAVTQQTSPVISTGLKTPRGVAVDGQGNIYIADTGNSSVKEWGAATQQVTSLLSSGLATPGGVAVDGSGNVYIADTGNNDIKEFTPAWVGPLSLNEPASAGTDSVQYLPASLSVAATSDQPWLTVTSAASGLVALSFSANSGNARIAHVSLLGEMVTVTQAALPTPPALGENSTTVGSSGGTGSVLLITSTGWTTQTNASWLHLTGSTNGSGDALIEFTYDANAGTSSRTGTLTIDELTFTVTQAGSAQVSDPQITTLAPSGLSNLNGPSGVAVDSQENIYIADSGNNAIKMLSAATLQVTTLVSTGLNGPLGIAVDGLGNIYIADTGNNAVEEWSASTQQMTTLVSTGLNGPGGVAVDSQGNVYIADTGNNAIEQWIAETQEVVTLVDSGLSGPGGVAVDGEGNVYIADTGNGDIVEWNASTKQTMAVVSTGLGGPRGVALDGQGNIYIADTGNNTVEEWTAATQQVTPLVSSGIIAPGGVAVDLLGNVYIADTGNNDVQEFTPAWVGPLSLNEQISAGSDSIQYLPASLAVTATSDQSWLTINSAAAGTVTFAFTANSASTRVAHIAMLGQTITVTQIGGPGNVTTIAGSTPQTTVVSGSFGSLLAVTVISSEATPTPMAGVTVTFTAPSTGASAIFANGATSAVTNFAGVAVIAAAANGTAGSYTVSASVAGVAQAATFVLTNAPASPQYVLTVNAEPGGTAAPPTGELFDAGSPVSLVSRENPGYTFSGWTGGVVNPNNTSTSVVMNGPETVTANFIPPAFTADVPSDAFYFDAVNLLSLHNITSGCAVDQFCPDDNVTRAQMAIFIVRSIMGTDDFTYTQTPYFTDVTPTTFGFAWIQKLRDLNITNGCGPSLFCPTSSVTRAETAVFIIRARYGSQAVVDYPATPYFTDVQPGAFAYNFIQRMAEDVITNGCTATTYCPDDPVTRGEMAVFIMRGGFNQLLPASKPVITQVSPAVFVPGQMATVTIDGSNTNFVQGSTVINPIPGFTIGTVTVISPTSVMVELTAGASTTLAPASLWITTPTGEAVLPNAVSIQ
jgi:sugar lactone lactonase YvrE